MLKDSNFLSNSEHQLSETGNAKLSILFLNKNSQETYFYISEIAVSRGNTKADTPKVCLFRAGLRNAVSSSALNANVRKITWSHIAQPVSQFTSHYKVSLEPKSPPYFEILPATGEGWESEEESGGRRKRLLPLPNLAFPLKAVLSPLDRVKTRATFFSSALEKDGQKSPTLLYSCKYLPLSLPGLLGSWSTRAAACTGLQSPAQRRPSLLMFLIFNSHLKPSELLQSITKCPLSFSQNQAFNFKNIYLDLWEPLTLPSDCTGKWFHRPYIHKKESQTERKLSNTNFPSYYSQ